LKDFEGNHLRQCANSYIQDADGNYHPSDVEWKNDTFIYGSELRDIAREWIESVRRGKFPYILDTKRKGEIAKDLWDDSKFTLGMEYGLICAFELFFNLDNE
jgi:hypothetical protein